jgi:hypothetical protein
LSLLHEASPLLAAAVADAVDLQAFDCKDQSGVAGEVEHGAHSSWKSTEGPSLDGLSVRSNIIAPKSVGEALRDPIYAKMWQHAIDIEVGQKERMQTYTEAKFKDYKGKVRMHSLKCLFSVKYNGDGSVSRFKCRLYYAGFWDKPGVDYEHSWSAMPRCATGKLLDAIACTLKLYIYQTDVVCCFNQSRQIQRLVIGRLPTEMRAYDEGGDEIVWRALVCSYGLPEATREWAETFDEWILEDLQCASPAETNRRQKLGLPQRRFNFQKSQIEESLYVLKDGDQHGHFFINRIVDDVRAYVANKELWVDFWKLYRERFEITGGELPFSSGQYNGANSTYDYENGVMTYDVETSIDKLMQKLEMTEITERSYPMIAKATANMSAVDCPKGDGERAECDVWRDKYVTTVCTALWLSNYMPEISFTTAFLARWLKNPGKKMWGAAKVLLGYLRGARSCKYYIRRAPSTDVRIGMEVAGAFPELCASADASHNDNDDGTTTIGYLLEICGATFLARTLKLKHVTLSVNESEISAQTECGRDVLCYRALLKELGFPQPQTTMYCDSRGAVSVAERRSPTHRTKPVRLRDKWISQLVSSKECKMHWVPTNLMKADGLTKPLPGPGFKAFRRSIRSEPDDKYMT